MCIYYKGHQGLLVWHCEGHVGFWYTATSVFYFVFGLNIFIWTVFVFEQQTKKQLENIFFWTVFYKNYIYIYMCLINYFVFVFKKQKIYFQIVI